MTPGPIRRETIYQRPVYVTVPDHPDPYPPNPRWPWEPAAPLDAPGIDCAILDRQQQEARRETHPAHPKETDAPCDAPAPACWVERPQGSPEASAQEKRGTRPAGLRAGLRE